MKPEPTYQILDGQPLGKEWTYYALAINEATMITFPLYTRKDASPEDDRRGIYKHYKGNTYKFWGIALHEAAGDRYAIYQALYPPCKVWARPENDFFGAVEVDCVPRPRFERVVSP